MYIILTLLSIVIASISESIMDTLAHHFEESIFKNKNKNFWNPVYSSSNKWKNGDKSQGERFPLSSTLLVGFLDAWHLFKLIRTFMITIAFGLIEYHFNKTILLTISIRVIYGLIFTLFYEKLKR